MKRIGVFDSGIGGMTVVKELLRTVPGESIVYFGDTARVPYGSKSVETIRRYAREDTELLLSYDLKLIIVACNTVSALALDEVVRASGTVPVIGMIGPCAIAAVRSTRNGKIGIIGTEATIASKAYEVALKSAAREQQKEIITLSVACPLLVPLAEEGWTDHEATHLIVREYLKQIKVAGVDTLILGCTHYPVLESVLQQELGPTVTLINSGAEAARIVADDLQLSDTSPLAEHVILVSDVPRKFQQIGERFLGRPLPPVQLVQFRESWTNMGVMQ